MVKIIVGYLIGFGLVTLHNTTIDMPMIYSSVCKVCHGYEGLSKHTDHWLGIPAGLLFVYCLYLEFKNATTP